MDCPTRWNSTYLMLATALKYQAAFDRMAEQDRPYDLYFRADENGNRTEGPPDVKIGPMRKDLSSF